MTFQEIASIVCEKVGENDADSLDFAFRCATHRYRILWNAHDWPETKVRATFPVLPGATGQFLPRTYGQVIAGGWRVNLTDPPTQLVYRDFGWVLHNDPGVLATTATGVMPAYYWRGKSRGIPNTAIGQSLEFDVLNPGGELCDVLISGMAVINGDPVFTSELVSISGVLGQAVFSTNTWTSVDTLAKGLGNGNVRVAYPGGEDILGAGRMDLSYGRIEWFPVPSVSGYLDLEVKLKIPANIRLYDAPAIPHLEDAILAFAQADMLERQNLYTKAQAKTQEAALYLEGAKNLQRSQADYYQRFAPDIYDAN